jgi:hypothetical protein
VVDDEEFGIREFRESGEFGELRDNGNGSNERPVGSWQWQLARKR